MSLDFITWGMWSVLDCNPFFRRALPTPKRVSTDDGKRPHLRRPRLGGRLLVLRHRRPEAHSRRPQRTTPDIPDASVNRHRALPRNEAARHPRSWSTPR